ncbi:MAG: hypothetical protein DMF67_04410 [Acidobacteria bacterium]|nr:MAG: hypothetical protein DMF66_11710 [Acidobacteriota bacterium]PYS84606.1 MAG: hypothetical protein DMF67_04410 [Acidobacteriota bacterium]
MEGEHKGKAEAEEAGGGESPPPQVPPESEKSAPATEQRGLSRLLTRRTALIAVVLAALVSAFLYLRHNPAPLKSGVQKAKAVLGINPTPTPDPYAEAVSKVEEDRGEPAGRQAKVEVPAELKQYPDRHRFLAIQAASANEAGVRTPHDFAELAEMIARGDGLVEVPRLGRGYILFGVGGAATGELTHYDAKQGKSVPLFAGDDELKAYRDGLAAGRAALEAEQKDLGARLKAADKKDKEGRARLTADAAVGRKALGDLKDKEKLVASEYGTPKERQTLYAEYDTLAQLARSFGGRAYDLHDPASVKEFQQRMLSFARPAALAVLEELAQVYESEFQRPLPVTSLVRTDEYQRLLRESGNANAGDFSVEPHTTGFAFDIYYRFMSAREQEFVMGEIARLKKAGRVEALRELRDHYHVFAFPEGHAPDEKAVEKETKKSAKGK